jgi:hypothetical protein
MRCFIEREDRPSLAIDSLSVHLRDNPSTVNVASALLNNLQRAQFALNRAEADVLRFLKDAGTASEEQLRWLEELEKDLLS